MSWRSRSGPTPIRDGKVQAPRVVDESIYPRILQFFIVLPVYMISQQAINVVLAEAGCA